MPRSILMGIGAVVLAAGSATLQRHGPDQAVFCALGKSVDGHDIYCPRPVLNAGWPAPYVFDRPGISVENKIGIPEDDFRTWPLVADVAFFWLAVAALSRVGQALRILGKR